jgi:hypothetical protein
MIMVSKNKILFAHVISYQVRQNLFLWNIYYLYWPLHYWPLLI